MKKIILNLLISNILVVNSALVSSCGSSHYKNPKETNFILDIDDADNENPILPARGWKGTLLDQDSMQDFFNSEHSPYRSFDKEQS